MPLLPFGPDGVRGRTSLGTWDDRNIRRGERRDNNRRPPAAVGYGFFFTVTFGTVTLVVSFFTSTFGTTVFTVSVEVSTVGILTVSVCDVTRGVSTTTSPSDVFLHPPSAAAANASTTSVFFTITSSDWVRSVKKATFEPNSAFKCRSGDGIRGNRPCLVHLAAEEQHRKQRHESGRRERQQASLEAA